MINLTFLLSLNITLPLITAFIILALYKQPNLRDTIAIFLASITTIISIIILITVIKNNIVSLNYSPVIVFGSKAIVAFTISKINIAFALMVNFLWTVSILYSIGYLRSHKENKQSIFFSFFAISIFATNGIAFSSNLLTSFIFYEVLTLATLPLVAFYFNTETKSKILTYLYVLISSSVTLFLVAIVLVYTTANSVSFMDGGLFKTIVASKTLIFIAIVFFMFGIAKAGIMPMHIWLPSAMVAPTPVSALLHAVAVVKSGVFLITKIITEIFGIDYLSSLFNESILYYILLAIPLTTILVGSTVAIFQTSIKGMLAYSTVSQLSYIIVAVMILTPMGTTAAYLHILAHGFSKIALFFAAGAFISLAHIYNINQLSGMAKKMPLVAASFTLGAVSLIGLPFTIGFSSKYAFLSAALDSNNYLILTVIIISTILQTIYFLPIIYKMYFEEVQEVGAVLTSKTINTALLIINFFIVALFFASVYIISYFNI